MTEKAATRYKEIAQRLRGLREGMDFTQEELAAKVDATVELVQLYESGESEIPVSFLMDVAHACEVDLTTLLSGGQAFLQNYTVVRSGEGLSTSRRKDYDYKNLAARFSGRFMEPFLVRVPPKEREQVTCISHKGQEFSYMLEGRLELHLGGKIEILEPGDSVYFSSSLPHGLRGLDGKDAVFVSVII
ncbi:XRE family transcriptional regulator [Desulfovibrio sp. OttesenSCG-928-I05]|nr:XRE family transcriptional regulator [Desulfovibrio sp. OttesenSCG-928-I05]